MRKFQLKLKSQPAPYVGISAKCIAIYCVDVRTSWVNGQHSDIQNRRKMFPMERQLIAPFTAALLAFQPAWVQAADIQNAADRIFYNPAADRISDEVSVQPEPRRI
ncbi:hypothetical protein ACNKHO_06905 [Shigella flexneri]